MAKKGISIKELARELGITSKELITRCREASIPAQNSITKLPIATERIVRSWFDNQNTTHDTTNDLN